MATLKAFAAAYTASGVGAALLRCIRSVGVCAIDEAGVRAVIVAEWYDAENEWVFDGVSPIGVVLSLKLSTRSLGSMDMVRWCG